MKSVASVIMICLGVAASSAAMAGKEATICFAKTDCSNRFSPASAGDSTALCSGQCDGRTLSEMYEDGWTLIQIIENLNTSFGFVFEREKP